LRASIRWNHSLVCEPHAPDEFRAAGSAERVDEVDREAGDVDVDAVRHERDGARPCIACLEAGGGDALGHECGEAHDGGRMAQEHRREGLAAQPSEHGVAHRDHTRTAWPAGDHPHLADALARTEARERAGRAIFRGHHAEGAGRDEVDRIGRLAAVEQRRTARQREPRDLRGDLVDDSRSQALQQRQCARGVQDIAGRHDRRRFREIVCRIVS
jgi:hypothetical protein